MVESAEVTERRADATHKYSSLRWIPLLLSLRSPFSFSFFHQIKYIKIS